MPIVSTEHVGQPDRQSSDEMSPFAATPSEVSSVGRGHKCFSNFAVGALPTSVVPQAIRTRLMLAEVCFLFTSRRILHTKSKLLDDGMHR